MAARWRRARRAGRAPSSPRHPAAGPARPRRTSPWARSAACRVSSPAVGSVAVITGSAGLVGSEAARHFAGLGLDVVGIDNDLRAYFFGADGSTRPVREALERELPGYRHDDLDIRDRDGVLALFRRLGGEVAVVLHCAGQPSHDWAASE